MPKGKKPKPAAKNKRKAQKAGEKHVPVSPTAQEVPYLPIIYHFNAITWQK
jgi:hypothetical protein